MLVLHHVGGAVGGSPLIGKNVQKVGFYVSKEGSPASGTSGIAVLLRKAAGGVEYFGVS